MSVTATLEIDFSQYSDKIFDVILLFNKTGWIFKDEKMDYIPLNDNDDFNWQREDLSYEKLNDIVLAKQNAGELSVVRLYDNGGETGIELAASNTKEVTLWLDIDRKRIDGERYTDVSWYILNTVGRINKQDCVVQHFIFDEFE